MESNSSIQSVLLYNSTDSHGNYIPTKVEVNSWVNLMPGKTGGHAKDAMKHGAISNAGAYKAKVVDFKTRGGVVTSVYVQHAYMFRHLDLHPAHIHVTACNYLYPSECYDWIDPKSIMGVIVVIHADIGELTRGDRTHKDLLEDSVFFYNHQYIPPRSSSSYGEIKPIPLPKFDSPEWPLPDMSTTESFRAKFRLDFQNAMRPCTSSKLTHLSWFLPIGVFVDLFHVAENRIQKTKVMWIIKDVDDDLCASMMDKGWDLKITKAADVIKTVVHQQSLRFRYHIGRSTLYANFVYNRWRMLPNGTWEALDEYEPVVSVIIHCQVEDSIQDLEVGLSWTFSAVQQEILVQLNQLSCIDFRMSIVDDNAVFKVNLRNEKNYTVANVLPPKKLRLITRD